MPWRGESRCGYRRRIKREMVGLHSMLDWDTELEIFLGWLVAAERALYSDTATSDGLRLTVFMLLQLNRLVYDSIANSFQP